MCGFLSAATCAAFLEQQTAAAASPARLKRPGVVERIADVRPVYGRDCPINRLDLLGFTWLVGSGEAQSGYDALMSSPLRHRAVTPGLVLIVLAACLAAACATKRFDRLMRDWEGRPLSQLLTTWGPPASLYSDGKGGHVLAYVPAADSRTAEQRRAVKSGPLLADDILHGLGAQPVYEPRVSAMWRVYRLFFVDSRGQIYESQWKGDWVCCGM
jgi:hypothetical protein